MDLTQIRSLCDNYSGGLKRLAQDIGMSEANLHRCINNNKIQASDLEQIAIRLEVDIRIFFDKLAIKNDSHSNNLSQKEQEILSLSKELVTVIGKMMDLK